MVFNFVIIGELLFMMTKFHLLFKFVMKLAHQRFIFENSAYL